MYLEKEWPVGVTRADFMTIPEAAEALGFTTARALRDAIKAGRIDAYAPVFGRTGLVLRADIERFGRVS